MKPCALVLFSILSLSFVMPLESSAQQASSFEQLRLLVKLGDSIYVTDAGGKTEKGRIAELSNSSLSVTFNGVRRNLAQSDVVEIKQWRHDSLKNGAGIGAVTGLVFGILTVAVGCEGDCGAGLGAAVLGIYTGLGAGIGVGVDALIPTKETVFRNANRNSSTRIRFQPVLNRSSKGVLVSISF